VNLQVFPSFRRAALAMEREREGGLEEDQGEEGGRKEEKEGRYYGRLPLTDLHRDQRRCTKGRGKKP